MSKQRLGRNTPCWCGSGKKYKKCHLDQDKAAVERNKPLDPRAREYWEIRKSILPPHGGG
jgi:methionyl aminopeptidase